MPERTSRLQPCRAALAAAALAAALSACGSDSPGSTGGAGAANNKRDYHVQESMGSAPVDLLAPSDQTMVRALADAVCKAVGPCCQKSGRKVDTFCVENGAQLLARDILDVRASGGALDGAALDTCRTQLAAAAAGCSGDTRAQLLTACSAAFTGTVAVGQTCTSDAQCTRPAGSFALCKNGGVESGRCAQGKCVLFCDAPDQPFDTWKTCDNAALPEDFYCTDRCWYPSTPGACQFVCWCCVDNSNQTCEFTAFQTADNYDHYLCAQGRYSPNCQAAEHKAQQTCEAL